MTTTSSLSSGRATNSYLNSKLMTTIIFSLTEDRLLQMVDYLIFEPGFNDSPQRCFKYPFLASTALSIDNEHIQSLLFNNDKVFTKLFKFIAQSSKGKGLNATLGGYFNKVVSFWLLKAPEQVIPAT